MLRGNLVIAGADFLGNPFLEVVTNYGIDQVHNPLPRKTADIPFVW